MAAELDEDAAVRELIRMHELLLDRADRTDSAGTAAVLNLGLAVRLQKTLERDCLEPIERLLDADVLRRFAEDGSRLIRALDHLQEMCEIDAGSPDIGLLASALMDDLKALLRRETNAIYRPLQRLCRLRRHDGGAAEEASQS